jgi:hypothetical protein
MSTTREYYHEAVMDEEKLDAFLVVYCRYTKIANMLQCNICNVMQGFDRRVVSVADSEIFIDNLLETIKKMTDESKLKSLTLDINTNGTDDVVFSYENLASLSLLRIVDINPIEHD